VKLEGRKGQRTEALNPRSDILPRMTISSTVFYPAGPTLFSPFAAQAQVDPCAVSAYYTSSSHPKIFISSFYAMNPSLPMSARTGRSTARYTPGTNRRLCAGIVALSTGTTRDSPGHLTHVLVTSSSRHPERFVLPKGGWEQDESPEDAALREGWEEGTPPHSPTIS
jgi:NUDIX domain